MSPAPVSRLKRPNSLQFSKRAEDGGGKIKVIDVAKKESEIEVTEMISLHDVIEDLQKTKFPGLAHNRIPICNSASPLEGDFDALCTALIGTNVNCPVIINCQVGLSRSTTGCVSSCLFREFQLSASFEGLIETVPGVNLDLLRMDKYELEKDKDALFRGEFEVVRELVAALPAGDASKRECDKVIDKNGPAPKGTGIKQLRENIAESKLSYEIMDDAAQAFLKTKIMDNIQKYFYLICFTGYLRDQSKVAKDGITDEDKKAFALAGGKVSTPTESLKLKDTFVAWMDEKKNLRAICDDGKGKLQWEREIPQEALDNLNNLATTDLKTEVEGLIAGKTMTLDLYEILGQCTWGQGK